MNGLGTFIMAGNNTYTGGTNVQSGTLISNTNLSNGTLAITGGTTRVAAKAASNDPIRRDNRAGGQHLQRLSGPDQQRDGCRLHRGDFALLDDPVANRQRLCQRRRGPAPASTALAPQRRLPRLIQPRSAMPKPPRSASPARARSRGHSVDNTSVLVRYTLAGDANLDGKVNALDFNALATNFGTGSGKPSGHNGDFNYDGQVTTADFTAMAQNFSAPLADAPLAPVLGTLVPEPASLGLLSLAALLGMRRRRRGS